MIDDPLHKLSAFRDLILEWNSKINLTALRTPQEIDEILIGESARALFAISISGKRVLDFGSGAGIPGLVWAICEPSARVTSLEVRHKKIAFQKEVVRSTGVNAEIIQGRFPEAVKGREFDVVVSRAVGFSPRLFGDAVELLNAGGMLVRFAKAGFVEEGWKATSISPRATVMFHVKMF